MKLALFYFLISSFVIIAYFSSTTSITPELNNKEIHNSAVIDSIKPSSSTSPSKDIEIELNLPKKSNSISTFNSLENYKEAEVTAHSPDLTANWDLNSIRLPKSLVVGFFAEKQAAKIVYFDGHKVNTLSPDKLENFEKQDQQTLYVGNHESAERTAQLRRERSALYSSAEKRSDDSNSTHEVRRSSDEKGNSSENEVRNAGVDNNAPETPESATEKAEEEKPLPQNSFEIVSFSAGNRDDGSVLVPVSKNAKATLNGPDYSFASTNAKTDDFIRDLYSTVLSLGHNGHLLLMVSDDAYLVNKDGFDFAIFENVLVAGSFLFQEFAEIGVSENAQAESFKWFECKPPTILTGCVGAVPTSQGGDQFDLSEVNLDKIKYIWIRDLGNNKNYPSRWPTEGADLDAVRLKHVYKVK